ncbi:hypothetical protein FA95DRAFT_827361 [Auriscalpium vulgare]|uniref:Uncharacterized protein n=1 Tax=Auriscalpium vulgare TaxID=40419 RepID=A0ACB8R9Z7_9AGAM|nr:hypothetical protein FA95DRAFT_827361 [Auriscalpium vulgare]
MAHRSYSLLASPGGPRANAQSHNEHRHELNVKRASSPCIRTYTSTLEALRSRCLTGALLHHNTHADSHLRPSLDYLQPARPMRTVLATSRAPIDCVIVHRRQRRPTLATSPSSSTRSIRVSAHPTRPTTADALRSQSAIRQARARTTTSSTGGPVARGGGFGCRRGLPCLRQRA